MFYDNLSNICKERGTTPTAAVKACGFATGSIGGWKKGAWPNSEIVVSLAAHLNVSTDQLLLGHNAEQSPSDEFSGISVDGLRVGCLWDGLDEAGRAIILGQIYQRLEALATANRDPADELLKRAN